MSAEIKSNIDPAAAKMKSILSKLSPAANMGRDQLKIMKNRGSEAVARRPGMALAVVFTLGLALGVVIGESLSN
jgi:hypothetical protein